MHSDKKNSISDDSSMEAESVRSPQKISPTPKNNNYLVGFIAACFGVGSWLGVNATFLQIPLMINTAPEGWRLPSYVETINQFGNIGPLIYTLAYKIRRNRFKDEYLIYVILSMDIVAAMLMSFLHDVRVKIDGVDHSIVLFVLFYCFAFTGCTSSVLFMPFMGRFREFYLIMYFIGEGLSGLIGSIVAIIQGSQSNGECVLINTTNSSHYEQITPPPLFPTRDFFLFVFSLMLCSLTAFVILNKLKICKDQHDNVEVRSGNSYKFFTRNDCVITARVKKSLLLLIMSIAFFETGILASVQSYSCQPYGSLSYRLTVSFTLIMNPIAAFAAVFLPYISIRNIFLISGLNMIPGLYILATALMSPNPPLVDSVFGRILIVALWTIFMGIFKYITVTISIIMRSQGGKSLVWTGGLAQAGSTMGSILMFCIVNFTKVFTSKDPCT